QPLLIPVPVGSQLAQAPRWSYAVRGSYAWPVSDALKASLEAVFRHTDSQVDAQGDPFGLYGPNSDLRARATLDIGERWQAGVWGRNLTNNKDLTLAYLQIVGRTIYIDKPLSYGVDFTYRF